MKTNIKKLASQYVKIVEWSDEDGCYVGRCPELFGGGTHGDDEVKVYAHLSAMVEEAVEDLLAEKRTLPAPITAQKYSGKFIFRPGPELHKALSVRAWREGKSLNQVLLDAIRPASVGVERPSKRKAVGAGG
jgi:predicted HicB family RNase H-like nuclease